MAGKPDVFRPVSDYALLVAHGKLIAVVAAEEGPGRRDIIMAAIQRRPGIHKSQLQADLDMAWGTLTHHVHQLHRRRRISMLQDGHRVALFPARIPAIHHAALAQFAQPLVRRVVDVVRLRGASSIQEVADALDESRKPVTRCLKALAREGVMTRDAHGWGRFEVVEQRVASLEQAVLLGRSSDA